MAQAIRRPGKIEAGRVASASARSPATTSACKALMRARRISTAERSTPPMSMPRARKRCASRGPADLDLEPSGLEESESQIEAILAVLGNDPQERQRSFASVAAPAMHERDRTPHLCRAGAVAESFRKFGALREDRPAPHRESQAGSSPGRADGGVSQRVFVRLGKKASGEIIFWAAHWR